MDSIGMLFAGAVVLIVMMAFLKIWFPPDESKQNSISIRGTGSGVDVVLNMVKNEKNID